MKHAYIYFHQLRYTMLRFILLVVLTVLTYKTYGFNASIIVSGVLIYLGAKD